MSATDAALQRALDVKKLQLPATIPVVDIDYERYTDTDGEPALRVWVIFEEASDAGDFTGEDVSELKFAIRESLRRHQVEEFAYIFIVSEDERASLESAD